MDSLLFYWPVFNEQGPSFSNNGRARGGYKDWSFTRLQQILVKRDKDFKIQKGFKVHSDKLEERYILNAAAGGYLFSLFVVFVYSG